MQATEDWISYYPGYSRQYGPDGIEIHYKNSFEKPLVHSDVTADSRTMVIHDVNRIEGAPLHPSQVNAYEYMHSSGRLLDTLDSISYPVAMESSTEKTVRAAVAHHGAQGSHVIFQPGSGGWWQVVTPLVRLAERTTGRTATSVVVDREIFRSRGPRGNVNLRVWAETSNLQAFTLEAV
ncbi:hypothetical protein PspLS_08456 [Pyricularia sp. CBS 133598]|nr:hypothetical protein PspLS_08456 [Pyricularia sp. CBS 133598]